MCGWIVPNHLEVSLQFYDRVGKPIGSFGLEHGDAVYRTRAGNLENPTGVDLAADIGKPGHATVNAHIARLMWFIHDRAVGNAPAGPAGDPGFLIDLMGSIERSGQFINPAAAAQDASLAVFMGRPLAVVRSVVSVASAGGIVPVSQNTAALVTAVTEGLTDYAAREARTSAGLRDVKVPLQLGNATHTDDGLVAFLPETGSPTAPYRTVLSAFAPDGATHGVEQPGKDAVALALGDDPITLTALVDPRSPVRVGTPLLPTATLRIPPDQYLRAMQELALTFTTRPVLRDTLDLRLPLPAEPGYAWSWIAPGQPPAPLSATPAPDVPIRGYGPNRLIEGWLDLSSAPVPLTELGPAIKPVPRPVAPAGDSDA